MKQAFTLSTLFHSLFLAFAFGLLTFKAKPIKTYTVDLNIGNFGLTEGGNEKEDTQSWEPEIPSDVITPEENEDHLQTRSADKKKKQTPPPPSRRSNKITAPADKSFERTGSSIRGNGGPGQASIGSGMSDFPHPAYMEAVRRKIVMQWQAAFWRDNRLERKAQVIFTIKRDGSLAGSDIEEKSGDSNFDLACLRGISQAAPFPPLPEGLPDKIRVIFDFEISY